VCAPSQQWKLLARRPVTPRLRLMPIDTEAHFHGILSVKKDDGKSNKNQ
jgi:hypothetical protein